MANGQFKIKNVDNLTTEQVKGVTLGYKDAIWGTVTHADEDYIYAEFEHSGDGELIINLEVEKCSMEIRGD